MSDQTDSPTPASPEMADRLEVNRTGRLTRTQRRTALIGGVVALVMVLCPVMMLVQVGAVLLTGGIPADAPAGILFTAAGVVFLVLFAGLIGANVQRFLPEAFGRHPVRYARGPLRVHESEGHRPELPFSFIVGDYSFAPFVVPPEVELRVGAPYLVYYSRRSRLLLSIAALDESDANRWKPQFDNPPPYSWH